MTIAHGMLRELEMEAAITRKFLERVPEGQYNWKPHTKSMAMGRLAGHLAELNMWGKMTIEKNEIDIAPVGQEPFKPIVVTSKKQLLDEFENHLKAFQEILSQVTDAQMMEPWSLKASGKTLFSIPRVVCLRNFVFNHAVHHRAQLGVYFRLLEIPVPQTYGPSADDAQM